MFLATMLALLLISILPGLAQHTNQAVLEAPGPTATLPCHADQIQSMNVSTACSCPKGSARYSPGVSGCPVSGKPTEIITARSSLKTGTVCDDRNVDCNSCYLWFHGLCSCKQDIQAGRSTNCKLSNALTPGQKDPPIWMMNNDHTLITTTHLMAGILELEELKSTGSPPVDRRNDGWLMGQNLYLRASQALAMNSVVTRSEEQIHIHVCDLVPGNLSGSIRSILTCLPKEKYKTLTKVDNMPSGSEMLCRVSPSKTARIDNISDDIKAVRGMSDICIWKIGAGIVADGNDYTWACVTTGRTAAEWTFCN